MTAKLVQAWTSSEGIATRLVVDGNTLILERQTSDSLGGIGWKTVINWDLSYHRRNYNNGGTADLLEALLDAAAKREQLAKTMTYADPQDNAAGF